MYSVHLMAYHRSEDMTPLCVCFLQLFCIRTHTHTQAGMHTMHAVGILVAYTLWHFTGIHAHTHKLECTPCMQWGILVAVPMGLGAFLAPLLLLSFWDGACPTSFKIIRF